MSQTPTLGSVMAQALGRLSSPAPAATAARATLRSGAGRRTGEHLPSLSITLEAIAPILSGPSGALGWSERAAHMALTHYARHARAGFPAHAPGVGVGAAVACLERARGAGRPVSLMQNLACARTEAATLAALRRLVEMLRTESIGLDYVQLAYDLASMNTEPGRRKVALRWSKDRARTLYATTPTSTPDDTQE